VNEEARVTGDLREWQELQRYFLPLSHGEKASLELSVREAGQQAPIIALPDGRIIDGLHRLGAVDGAKKKPTVTEFPGSEEDAFILGISLNCARRQMSMDQKHELALKLKKRGLTQERIAQIMGVENTTVSTWLAEKGSNSKIENASLDLRYTVPRGAKVAIVDRVAKGETQAEVAGDYHITRRRVGQIVKAANQKQKAAKGGPGGPLPEGKFAVLYADPPWQYDFSETESRSIETKYQTLTPKQIADYEVKGRRIADLPADDCVLFLWATNPKLLKALEVIAGWGFTYKTNMAWVKKQIGMGYWVRAKHELLLIATKGSPPVPSPAVRPPSVIEAARRKHSQKPEAFRAAIELMCPHAPSEKEKIELFARKIVPGWTAWGNEVGD